MNNQVKLYKCTKGTCSKCLDDQNPYMIEDEFKSLLDSNNIIQCPEGHLDCGIKEVDPADLPKPPKDWKKLLLIGGVIVIGLALIFGIFKFTLSTPSQIKPPTVVVASSINKGEIVKHTTVIVPKAETIGTVGIKKPEPPETIKVKPDPMPLPTATHPIRPTPKETKSKNFPGGSKYLGDIVKGLMHGNGKYTYGQRELISVRDKKNRYAEAGDYIIGRFECDKLEFGMLYDQNGKEKEYIVIGGVGCKP